MGVLDQVNKKLTEQGDVLVKHTTPEFRDNSGDQK